MNGKSIRINEPVDIARVIDIDQDQNSPIDEQFIFDLGFSKKFEEEVCPQIDSYFPKGIVYKITDLDTKEFYIGSTIRVEEFHNGEYNGSGNVWREHYYGFENEHSFKREVLKEGFKTPKEMFDCEVDEIQKFFHEENGKSIPNTPLIYNKKTSAQPNHSSICEICGRIVTKHAPDCPKIKKCKICGGINGHHSDDCPNLVRCPECGGKRGNHKVSCSKYTERSVCEECGGVNGHHKDNCSKSKGVCPECGYSLQSYKHAKWCSHYKKQKDFDTCEECGGTISSHKKWCSHYKNPEPCPECGKIKGHKKSCSKYKAPKPCPECGGLYGHKNTCSKYKVSVCPECGGKGGNHKDECSKSLGKCPECGYSLQSRRHAPTCSRYKKPKECPPCPEGGGKRGNHKANCSKNKAKKCPECGFRWGHKKTCSKHKDNIKNKK